MERRLFRLLLFLYPARFYERFGTNILDAFDAGRAECRTPREVRGFWVRIIADFLKTVPRAQWDAHTGSRAPQNAPKTKERELMFDLMKDVQLAFRGLVRKPGPALIAILALGLGIGHPPSISPKLLPSACSMALMEVTVKLSVWKFNFTEEPMMS